MYNYNVNTVGISNDGENSKSENDDEKLRKVGSIGGRCWCQWRVCASERVFYVAWAWCHMFCCNVPRKFLPEQAMFWPLRVMLRRVPQLSRFNKGHEIDFVVAGVIQESDPD